MDGTTRALSGGVRESFKELKEGRISAIAILPLSSLWGFMINRLVEWWRSRHYDLSTSILVIYLHRIFMIRSNFRNADVSKASNWMKDWRQSKVSHRRMDRRFELEREKEKERWKFLLSDIGFKKCFNYTFISYNILIELIKIPFFLLIYKYVTLHLDPFFL